MITGDFISPEIALEHVGDPSFNGNLLFAVEAPPVHELSRTITSTECALAERFQVDRGEEEQPLVSFELGSTWKVISNFYTKQQSSAPRALIADLEIGTETANARFLVPLTRAGLGRKAVIATYTYGKALSPHSRSELSSMKLTRTPVGKIALAENPFASCKPNPEAVSAPRISDHRIFTKKTWSGPV